MMKYNLYIVFIFFAILLFSCKKDDPNFRYEKNLSSHTGDVWLYTKQALANPISLNSFPRIAQEQTYNFNAVFGGLTYPQNDVLINYSFSQEDFDSLNAGRQAQGLAAFEKFPEDAYEIVSPQIKISAGETLSELGTLKYNNSKFDLNKDYVLPLKMSNDKGFNIRSGLSTLIFLMLKPKEVAADRSVWGITANSQQDGGIENTGLATALLDGNVNTIWHSQWTPAADSYPYIFLMDMKSETYISKIGMIARQNDAVGPNLFKLEASTDNTTWNLILESQNFDPKNKMEQNYPIAHTGYWRYLKLTLLKGVANHAHLAEFNAYTLQ